MRGKPEECQRLVLIPRETRYRVGRCMCARLCKNCIVPTQGLGSKVERSTEV